MKQTLVLGIETSCDETGVALYELGKGLKAHKLYSQIKMHAEYGGVVPELASRDHVRKLIPLIRELFTENKLSLDDISAIAYTKGPGLSGALLVGTTVANALGYALKKPVIQSCCERCFGGSGTRTLFPPPVGCVAMTKAIDLPRAFVGGP